MISFTQIFKGFFSDFKNTNFSEHHLNECFCSGFIFRLQCISPASDAKSFRLEIRLKKCVTNLKIITGKLKNNKIPNRNNEKLPYPSFSVWFFKKIFSNTVVTFLVFIVFTVLCNRIIVYNTLQWNNNYIGFIYIYMCGLWSFWYNLISPCVVNVP